MWTTLCPISLRIEISRAILEPVWRAIDDLQFVIWAEIPDMGKISVHRWSDCIRRSGTVGEAGLLP